MPELLPDPNTLEWDGDLKRKAANTGAAPARKKRDLSPEMEKQFNEATPLSAFLRNAANAFSFNQADRLATITGAPLEEQHELSARLEEKFPKSSLFGGIGGSMVGGAGVSKLAARAAPSVFGRNTLRSAAAREGTVGAGTAAVSEGVKSAEDRGEFSPGHVLASGLLGSTVAAGAGQLPALFGHAPTMVSKTRSTPLTEAERAGMTRGREFGEHYGFRDDAALDLAQQARFSEQPSLREMAANMERIKGKANPGARGAQEDAFRRTGLDRQMDASVPGIGERGQMRQYPDLSGKSVGQTRERTTGTDSGGRRLGGFPATSTLRPTEELPEAVQRALDTAYETRRAVWDAQQRYGTGTPGRAAPQRGELKMWEEVLDPRHNPLSREDLEITRAILGRTRASPRGSTELTVPGEGPPQGYSNDAYPFRSRMFHEQKADDIARIRGAVRDAPATPNRIPDDFRLGFGIPFVRGNFANVDIPIPGGRRMPMTARNTRAAELLKDPSMADIIGRLTEAQATSGGATRGLLEELIRSLTR